MTRALLTALALAAFPACFSTALVGEPTTASSSGTSATGSGSTSASGATTASATGVGTSSASTAATSTSGAELTSSSSSGSSSGGSGSDGGFDCPSGFGYVNGNCVALTCVPGLATPCALADGGLGTCAPDGCLDFGNDQNNCGALGVICASDVRCIAGVCQSPSSCAAGVCPSGATCLGGQCTYTNGCTGAPSYAQCSGSSGSGSFNCCTTCTQLIDDPNNCGSCGNVCPTGSPCQNGACIPTTCRPGATPQSPCAFPDGGAGFTGSADIACCGTACVDLYSDPNNCGSCGESCPSGQSCQEGDCSGAGCTTSAQCGSGEVCSAGTCLVASVCSPTNDGSLCALQDQTTGMCCAGTCVSSSSDLNNCGSCGVVCGSGTCYGGQCTDLSFQCSSSQGAQSQACLLGSSPGMCCDGTCVATDGPSNCGVCGVSCPTGTTCNGGLCSAECTSSSQCPQGTVCGSYALNIGVNGVCVPATCSSANEGQPCGTSGGQAGTCCAGSCVDVFSDSSNCGGCGFACAAGSTCQGEELGDGPLIQCNAGEMQNVVCASQADCPAGTVCPMAPYNDKCDPTCSLLGEGDECIFGLSGTLGNCHSGQCVAPTCADICPGGVCLTSTDGDFYCIALGTTCPETCGPGTSCFNGSCTSVSCLDPSDAPCPAQDGNVGMCVATDAGVTCVDTTSDPSNCGAIGVACPSGQTCTQGLCSGTPAPCNTPGSIGGFCNFDAGYGWNCCQAVGCVDLYDDVHNCGSCGTACGVGQTCTLGICG